MLTKEEMERVWNEKPVGYLKTLKKKKKYQVTYRSGKTIYSEYNTKELWVVERQSLQYIIKPENGYDFIAISDIKLLT